MVSNRCCRFLVFNGRSTTMDGRSGSSIVESVTTLAVPLTPIQRHGIRHASNERQQSPCTRQIQLPKRILVEWMAVVMLTLNFLS
jgi:hypothetical protein